MFFHRERQPTYSPVEQSQCLFEGDSSEKSFQNDVSEPESRQSRPTSLSSWLSRCGIFFLVIILLSVIIYQQICLSAVDQQQKQIHKPKKSDWTRDGIEHPRNLERIAHAQNVFLSENETEADLAWESIQAGHGAVKIDPQWSGDHNMVETMRHPDDSTKGVYLIAAYHDIHCLQWLRRHFKALLRGDPITWHIEHDWHCFDTLRQQTMCHADDTLLYCSGRGNIGNNQVRRCRDWDALRDWASDHTAGYFDYDGPPPEISRWGNSDGGDDGLPHGSLLG